MYSVELETEPVFESMCFEVFLRYSVECAEAEGKSRSLTAVRQELTTLPASGQAGFGMTAYGVFVMCEDVYWHRYGEFLGVRL